MGPRIRALWRNLMRREAADADLDLGSAPRSIFVDEQIAASIDPAEARRLATINSGGRSHPNHRRAGRGGAGLEAWWRDVTFGARLLRRHPVFTITAVISLGIGIGATTTIFTLVNALLLQQLQVAEPHRLVEFGRTTQFGRGTAFSYPAYERLRDESAAFSGMVALSKSTFAAETRPVAGGQRGGWSRATSSRCLR